MKLRSRQAWGEFEGIEVSVKLDEPSGFSTAEDQFASPPFRDFRFGSVHFEFLKWDAERVEVRVNSHSLGILSPGDRIEWDRDGRLYLNEKEVPSG